MAIDETDASKIRVAVLGRSVDAAVGDPTGLPTAFNPGPPAAQANVLAATIPDRIINRAINTLYTRMTNVQGATESFTDRFDSVIGAETAGDQAAFDAIGSNLIQAVHDLQQGGGGTGGTAFEEPPDDGKLYGRTLATGASTGTWQEVVGGSGSGLSEPATFTQTATFNGGARFNDASHVGFYTSSGDTTPLLGFGAAASPGSSARSLFIGSSTSAFYASVLFYRPPAFYDTPGGRLVLAFGAAVGGAAVQLYGDTKISSAGSSPGAAAWVTVNDTGTTFNADMRLNGDDRVFALYGSADSTTPGVSLRTTGIRVGQETATGGVFLSATTATPSTFYSSVNFRSGVYMYSSPGSSMAYVSVTAGEITFSNNMRVNSTLSVYSSPGGGQLAQVGTNASQFMAPVTFNHFSTFNGTNTSYTCATFTRGVSFTDMYPGTGGGVNISQLKVGSSDEAGHARFWGSLDVRDGPATFHNDSHFYSTAYFGQTSVGATSAARFSSTEGSVFDRLARFNNQCSIYPTPGFVNPALSVTGGATTFNQTTVHFNGGLTLGSTALASLRTQLGL